MLDSVRDEDFAAMRRALQSRKDACPLGFIAPIRRAKAGYDWEPTRRRHLNRVCRLGVGDFVEVFDGRGLAMRSEVVATGADWVELMIAGPPLPERPSPFALTLATAVPKGDRFDWLVEKATELGVDRLIPIVTERSVVEPGTSKLSRLRKSIIEASKQSGRNRLMVLESPLALGAVDRCSCRIDEIHRGFGGTSGATRAADSASRVRDPGCRAGRGLHAARKGSRPSGELVFYRLGVNTLRIETAALAGCAIVFSKMQESNE